MWQSLIVALAVFTQENEAEKLFQKMEAKLQGAGSIRLVFDSKVESDHPIFKGIHLKGTVAILDGKKLRSEMTATKKGETFFKVLTISDGTQMADIQGDAKPKAPVPAVKVLPANLMTMAARAGFFFSITPLPPEPFANPNFDLKNGYAVSAFKLGAKEKIGGRDAQRIDYLLKIKGNEGGFPSSLWLDLKTGLPLKRQVIGEDAKIFFSETYEIALDTKLDAKMFELPK